MNDILNKRYEESRDMSLLAYDQYRRLVSWVEEDPLEHSEREKYFQRLVCAQSDPSNVRLQALAQGARSRLVESYQPLVLSQACKYARVFPWLDVMDLVQEGNLGLLDGLSKCSGVEENFIPVLHCCIRDAIRGFIRGKGRMVCFDWYSSSLLKRLSGVQSALECGLGRSPTSVELAGEMGITQGRVCELLSWRQCWALGSLEGIVEDCGLVEDTLVVLSLFQGGGETPVGLYWETFRECVQWVLSCVLSDSQRRVIVMRYGLSEEDGRFRSQSDVACSLGKTADDVQAIERRAFERIRSALSVVREGGQVRWCMRPGYTEQYCTSTEAAIQLGVGPSKVHAYIQQGRLRAVRVARGNASGLVWMVERASVDAIVQEVVNARESFVGKETIEVPEGFYTIKQVAQRLGVSVGAVHKYIRQGRLSAMRKREGRGKSAPWFVSGHSVEAFLLEGQAVA